MKKILLLAMFAILLNSCSSIRLKQPFKTERARIGESTSIKTSLLDSVTPVSPIIAGVYKFRDQTGQYKQVEVGTSWSTAVTQGATTILMKALEDSKWFIPLERENLSNLLNERQIIRNTKKNYSEEVDGVNKNGDLPPLLFANIILEGGIIGYDSNIRTGGAGARYLGIGASTNYREDRISIYLRAVSTTNGQVLKTVYVTKTILSQAISANVFKYIDTKKILEVDVGITQNEPKQLAVKEAIDKAVEDLIIEGLIDGLWVSNEGEAVVEKIREEYEKEVEIAANTKLYERRYETRRAHIGISISGGGVQMRGDYSNVDIGSEVNFGFKKVFKNEHISWNNQFSKLNVQSLTSGGKDLSYIIDSNIEYMFFPYEKLTPFVYGGGGFISKFNFNEVYTKVQAGLGIEFFPVNKLGISFYGEYDVSFTDQLDNTTRGSLNDHFMRFGGGLTYYFGNFKNNK